MLVQREMERGPLSVSEYSALRAGIFKASESTESDEGWPAQGGDPRAAVHRLNVPTELSLSMVASPQCRFRFARQNYCRAADELP